jgi:hypothetical protein
MTDETVEKIRGAVEDRATWFALLFKEFAKILPHDEVVAASRKAITAYGKLKASRDPKKYNSEEFLDAFVRCGAAKTFDARIEKDEGGMINFVGKCALVDAWKKLGCTKEEIDLYCDIAMDGDRSRAKAHGLDLRLGETIGKGDDFCSLGLYDEK